MTITDDGRDPAGLPMGFDAEGVRKQRLALIEPASAGTSSTTADRRQRRTRSTGHGLPAPNPYGPFPTTW